MAQRKLRVIQPNRPDALVPNVQQNIDSYAEIIKNTRQQMRVELVEVDKGEINVIQVLMESSKFHEETKKTNVIKNLADENAELKRKIEEMMAANTDIEQAVKRGRNKKEVVA